MEKLPIIGMIEPFVVPIIIFFSVILLLPQKDITRKFYVADLVFILMVILTVILSIAIHKNTYDVVMERYFGKVFMVCFPYFILGLIMQDNDETLDFLGFWGKFSIVIGVVYLYYMLNIGNPDTLGDDNMGLAYNYLLVEMLVVINAFRNKKLSDIIISIVGGIMVISLGTRGPVLLLALFAILCVLNNFLIHNKKKVLNLGIVTLLAGLIIYYYKDILRWLIDLVSEIGLSTRVLEKLLLNNILESVERENIKTIMLEKISERPLLGYGIGGEWQFVNWNAHNMYLTFLNNYGVIFGSLFIIMLVYISLKALLCNKNRNAQFILIMFICLVFVKGFFSGDPISMELFFLVGFSLNQLREKAIFTKRSITL